MWDWGKGRLQQGFQKEFKQDACDQAITKQLGEISKQLNDMHIAHKQDQAKINDQIKMILNHGLLKNTIIFAMKKALLMILV